MPDANTYFWLFFKLRGRVGRAAYFFAGFLVFFIEMFFFYRTGLEIEGSETQRAWAFGFFIVALVATWVNFALTAKRFHDIGKPTAFAAISLVAGFILIIVLSLMRGDPGPNQYGPAADVPV